LLFMGSLDAELRRPPKQPNGTPGKKPVGAGK
jgi:hypothetical protein